MLIFLGDGFGDKATSLAVSLCLKIKCSKAESNVQSLQLIVLLSGFFENVTKLSKRIRFKVNFKELHLFIKYKKYIAILNYFINIYLYYFIVQKMNIILIPKIIFIIYL